MTLEAENCVAHTAAWLTCDKRKLLKHFRNKTTNPPNVSRETSPNELLSFVSIMTLTYVTRSGLDGTTTFEMVMRSHSIIHISPKTKRFFVCAQKTQTPQCRFIRVMACSICNMIFCFDRLGHTRVCVFVLISGEKKYSPKRHKRRKYPADKTPVTHQEHKGNQMTCLQMHFGCTCSHTLSVVTTKISNLYFSFSYSICSVP